MSVISSTKVSPSPAVLLVGVAGLAHAERRDAARKLLLLVRRIRRRGHADVDVERGRVGGAADVLEVQEDPVRRLLALGGHRGLAGQHLAAHRSDPSGRGWSSRFRARSTESRRRAEHLDLGLVSHRSEPPHDQVWLRCATGAPPTPPDPALSRGARGHQVVVLVAELGEVDHLAGRVGPRSRLAVGHWARRTSVRRSSPGRRATAGVQRVDVVRLQPVPGLPEAVDVRVVQPEDRVQRRRCAGPTWPRPAWGRRDRHRRRDRGPSRGAGSRLPPCTPPPWEKPVSTPPKPGLPPLETPVKSGSNIAWRFTSVKGTNTSPSLPGPYRCADEQRVVAVAVGPVR